MQDKGFALYRTICQFCGTPPVHPVNSLHRDSLPGLSPLKYIFLNLDPMRPHFAIVMLHVDCRSDP